LNKYNNASFDTYKTHLVIDPSISDSKKV